MLRFIHPSIVDLYLVSMEQDCLNEVIDGYDVPEDWPEELANSIIDIAKELNIKHNKALEAVGSEVEIAQQLILFNCSGGSA